VILFIALPEAEDNIDPSFLQADIWVASTYPLAGSPV